MAEATQPINTEDIPMVAVARLARLADPGTIEYGSLEQFEDTATWVR